MIRLSDYQMFVTVVETGSLSAAADQLHRSVSAVSKQLSRFEADLGVCLVQRSTHALTVTEPGKEFYHRCRAILEDIADAEAMLTEGTETLVGTLRISLPEVLINAGVMPLLGQFCDLHSGVRLDIRVSNRLDNMEKEGLDAALRIATLSDSRLTAITLAQARTCICASPGYLERWGTPRDLTDVVERHRLLLPDFVNLSEQLSRLFPVGKRPNIDIRRAHRLNSEHALLAGLRAGLGIGFVLDLAVNPAIEQGVLVPLLPELALPTQPVQLIFRRGVRLPARLETFKAFMISQFSRQITGTRIEEEQGWR